MNVNIYTPKRKAGKPVIKFMLCESCSNKPGTPDLCKSCYNNRSVILYLAKKHDVSEIFYGER